MKRITIPLNKGINIQQINALVNSLGGHIIRTFKYVSFVTAELPEGTLVTLLENEVISDFFEDKEVFALEQTLPWGVDRIDADLVQKNYGIKGYGVKVAVVDTGVDLNHPDLKVYGGASFISSTYQDDNGHGTHVAGTIAALDNGEGLIGVAPEAQIYALKVLNSLGSGSFSDVAAAIEWSITNKMDIISMSLGGSSSDPLLAAAVVKAYQTGILIIAAAGNSGNTAGSGDNVGYPAKFPEVIAVAAIDESDKRASFSSTGPDVEVAAPGVNIMSTYLGSTFKALNGTSMATPHVSGLAALIKSAYPVLSNEDIRKILDETAIDLGASGRDPWYGFGLISAPAAVQRPGPDNSPPQIVFKSPNVSQTISGVFKIEILAQDPSGVTNLKLLIDDVLVSMWSTPPYKYYWDTTRANVGSHYLAVEATDGAGNIAHKKQQIFVGVTVNLSEPKDFTVIKDIVPVKASFSNNGHISKTEFYLNEVLKESKQSIDHQVEFFWDSREVNTPGFSVHNLKVMAIADGEIQTSASKSVLLRNPVVTITEPKENSILFGDKVTVSAHCTDSDGIKKLEFYLDNGLIGIITLPPFTLEFDNHNLTVGNHLLKAVVYSKTGHVAESAGEIIQKPTAITFISPQNGDVIKGKSNITVSFSNPVDSAELFVKDISLGAKTVYGIGPVSWLLDTTVYPDLTTAALKIIALTSRDKVSSLAEIVVTIDNFKDLTPPEVSILSPQNGYIVDRPLVEFIAEVKDDKGIEYMDFYLDDIALPRVFLPPYKLNYDFQQEAAGKHYLLAKAADINGNIGISAAIEFEKPTIVTINYPLDKSKVRNTISEFKFNCADDIFGPVKLFIDGILSQTIQIDLATSGPVIIPFNWDTTKYSNLTDHSITVEVQTFKDFIISKGVAMVTVDNTVDTTPPVVALKSSQTGVVAGNVLLTAEASDNQAVEKVEFFMNGTTILSDREFPYEYQWESAGAGTGNYTFLAKAYDIAGNSSISEAINLAVPTKVSIISPASGSTIIGVFKEFTASFANPIQGNVNLYIDGEYKATTLIETPTTGPVKINYNWDTTLYPQISQHEIGITANTHIDQIPSTGVVKVYVDNRVDTTPPAIELSATVYRVIVGNNVTLTAKATDESGISRVEFYQEDVLVNTVNKTPYNYIWNTTGLSAGVYNFVAKAFDFAENVATSNVVTIGIATRILITNPQDGQKVSGVIKTFTAQFSDLVKGYAYLYIDATRVASEFIGTTEGPISLDYDWNTALLPNGSTHSIKIRVFTAVGAVLSEATIKVTIQN